MREAITPDFHLPDLQLYIEVTAMKQRHVTRKNRKLRRLHELHPGVRCVALYGARSRAADRAPERDLHDHAGRVEASGDASRLSSSASVATASSRSVRRSRSASSSVSLPA